MPIWSPGRHIPTQKISTFTFTNFYIYKWPCIHRLYFICACKFYVCACKIYVTVKIHLYWENCQDFLYRWTSFVIVKHLIRFRFLLFHVFASTSIPEVLVNCIFSLFPWPPFFPLMLLLSPLFYLSCGSSKNRWVNSSMSRQLFFCHFCINALVTDNRNIFA